MVAAFVKGRLPFQSDRQGKPHAATDAPDSSALHSIRHTSESTFGNKDGCEYEEEGSPEAQQGARIRWCYIWYYGYDKDCTTTYQWRLYVLGSGTAKNDSNKDNFCGAYYSTEGQRNSSTGHTAESTCHRQGQVQSQRQGGNL